MVVKMRSLLGLVFVFALACCSPIKTFKEIEYDIPLKKVPDHRSYFIKQNEMPVYEQQFAKIRELGEEINCKITGNCQGMKRGKITKKSMFDEQVPSESSEAQFQDQMMTANSMGGGMGGEDVSASMMEGKSNFMAGEKDPSFFGQQPQLDIKMSEKELAAASAGFGTFSNPMMNGAPDPNGGAAIDSPKPVGGGNDAMMRMQESQNAQIIEGSIQDKLNFMDKANNPAGPPGSMPGVTDPLSAFPHAPEAKDDTPNGAPGGVTEKDLMNAEDIQPNEMKGIDSFLKDSNHIDKAPEGSFSNFPSEDNFLGKTNVDFGGSHATIDNEANQDSDGPDSDPMPGPGAGPGASAMPGAGPGVSAMPGQGPAPVGSVSPGGPEVPTLNNLGLGMNPAEMGPPNTMPSLGFIQDNTRHMIQQNSDYKVPQSAFTNLWNSYMSSTQSLLGEKDPSANSRQAISRPNASKLHRRSNKSRRKL